MKINRAYLRVGHTGNMARYHEMTLSGTVGRGQAAFDSASAAVLSLRMHRKAGVKMTMPGERVRVGDVVRIAFGIGPLAIHGSCDVVWVADEPRRRASATRPGPIIPRTARRASSSTGPAMTR